MNVTREGGGEDINECYLKLRHDIRLDRIEDILPLQRVAISYERRNSDVRETMEIRLRTGRITGFSKSTRIAPETEIYRDTKL